jgi:hypothetical protein
MEQDVLESRDEKRLKSQHGFEWNLAPQGFDEWRLVEVVLRRRGLNVEASVVDPGWIYDLIKLKSSVGAAVATILPPGKTFISMPPRTSGPIGRSRE